MPWTVLLFSVPCTPLPDLSDPELVASLHAQERGTDRIWREIVRRVEPGLRAAMRSLPPSIQDDAVQEALIELVSRIRDLDPEALGGSESLRSWGVLVTKRSGMRAALESEIAVTGTSHRNIAATARRITRLIEQGASQADACASLGLTVDEGDAILRAYAAAQPVADPDDYLDQLATPAVDAAFEDSYDGMTDLVVTLRLRPEDADLLVAVAGFANALGEDVQLGGSDFARGIRTHRHRLPDGTLSNECDEHPEYHAQDRGALGRDAFRNRSGEIGVGDALKNVRRAVRRTFRNVDEDDLRGAVARVISGATTVEDEAGTPCCRKPAA